MESCRLARSNVANQACAADRGSTQPTKQRKSNNTYIEWKKGQITASCHDVPAEDPSKCILAVGNLQQSDKLPTTTLRLVNKNGGLADMQNSGTSGKLWPPSNPRHPKASILMQLEICDFTAVYPTGSWNVDNASNTELCTSASTTFRSAHILTGSHWVWSANPSHTLLHRELQPSCWGCFSHSLLLSDQAPFHSPPFPHGFRTCIAEVRALMRAGAFWQLQAWTSRWPSAQST